MKAARLAMLAVAMIVGSTTAVRAQDPQPQGRGEGRGGRGMQAQILFKGIALTDVQKTQVDSVMAKYRTQMQALREQMQNGGDREAMMTKNRELMGKQRDELRAILTDDQKKTFDANVEEMQQRMQNRQRQGPPSL